MDLLAQSKEKAEKWLNSSAIDDATKQEIHKLLADSNTKNLIDSFYKELEFGTGGLRGIMGVGANCINKYTIGSATQGLANYLKKSFPSQEIHVAIAYDSRNNSKLFASIVADVFSANGITVHLFRELRPTPLLSFAIRYLKCQSGVVITASHNPKEYNGYKAYWVDGAQLVPPHDKNVIEEVNAITDFGQIKFTADPSKIKIIGSDVEDAYYEEVKKLIPKKDSIRLQKNIPIVYSSLHGAGITMVPECLKRLGFENVQVVEEQKIPDGNFPTIQSPNPEEKSAMTLALQKAKKLNADLVMATDPDTDRVGIGIKDNKGEFFLLNGNQAFSLMMWFILKNLKNPSETYIAKTIVTTELIDDMAHQAGVTCFNTLTGFKYIAELMREQEGKMKFIAAGEESYGYMVGDFVRDKDAVSACAFFAAMAAAAKQEGQTLYDWLLQMYCENSFYKEGLVTLVRKGAEGEQQIKDMMKMFRENPPSKLGGARVIRKLDYKLREETNLISGEKKSIDLSSSDVLQFYTETGNKISVRPSGTEPKIKFYVSVKAKLGSKDEFDAVSQQLDTIINVIEKELIP
ncbi:MAG: phospho-sugar mutase [Cytophagales bacterium]|jgi:phosphoglucomutase|nr:phospho-sugar mutase [Cytophagales bacterium]MCA6387857.1 phospho-sugar mutase [Cytophagales bacterium]MCA6391413.1 phospho-sugar mutase [Cytophagales bacterium]MCA6394410.1 phospho-sugar mutase [Cytophagales bacterium]MCA6398398.1 phospho-sugar mutase [Cytophagales bacterium]